MLAHDSIAVGVVADLRIRVQRSAPGDLETGVRRVIEAIDGVTSVETVAVAAMTPNMNDIFVEVRVTATVRLAGSVDDERAAVRSELLDGFGVDAVEAVAIERSGARNDG